MSTTKMVRKPQNVVEYGLRLFAWGCQQQENSDLFLFGAWIVTQGCWSLQGYEGNLVSHNKSPSTNLCLNRGSISHTESKLDQFHVLPAFWAFPCMYISAQLSQVPTCSCHSTQPILFPQCQALPLHFPAHSALRVCLPWLLSYYQPLSKQVKCEICLEMRLAFSTV
jgi:hypothetical protein